MTHKGGYVVKHETNKQTSELRVRLVLTVQRRYFFCGSFLFYVCLWHSVLSVSCSLEVTCWEMADFLALLCVVFSCVFVTFPIRYPGSGMILDLSIPYLCILSYLNV